MTATAVRIESRDCKTPGCVGEADARLGPYAGLCRQCVGDARRKLSAIQRENAAKMPPETVAARANAGGAATAHAAAERRSIRDVLRAADAYRAAKRGVSEAEQRVAAARSALDAAIAGGDS